MYDLDPDLDVENLNVDINDLDPGLDLYFNADEMI
jgi:hypothetical protein